MPIQQLPLMKGVGKDFRNADYIDYLPVNMLATPKEILNSSGYLRSFPGIAKRSDVNGVSRGVEYNMAQNAVYRVCGGKLYKGESEVGDVAGSGRVSMAHGRTSQAVGVNGQLVEYRYDGTVKTVSNWPTDSGFTQYELGSVRDITRLRGRYAWSKDGTDSWFITDLEDESHPDRYSAQYRAESQPDGIIGIGTWRDFIVCFGSSTIEYFSLTGATTVGAALYVAQPSLMVQKGIAGTYCKTPFADSYAFISNAATGAPSVYIIGSGQVSPIASASIEKILRSYTADELADGVMEAAQTLVREKTRPAAQQSESELLRQREKIARGLDALEGYASDGTLRPDEVNLATISAACAIAYLNFRRVAPGWCATRPKLVRLVDSLFQRASFARTEPPVS